ncbi:MAG: GNAT family N-acetyltransferase [Acetobacteraceae bacterium]|nr:GNAT family N-acetyltransferase [Acetobacteraceae bacterium]
MFTFRRYTAAERTLWDHFIKASKNGTFLFLRDYMDYHQERFADASIIAASASGDIAAVFPANIVAPRLVSHAGLSHGGMIVDSAMTLTRAMDLFGGWLDHCRAFGIGEILYKTVPAIYHRLPAEEDRYALFRYGAALYRRESLSVVDLAATVPLQERRRRGAKKAAKHGLGVTESGDIEAFWPILEANLLSQHGQRPVHTAAEMRLLRDRFPDNIKLFGVFGGAEMCAGSVLYLAGPAVHAQYIAASEFGREVGALDLLFTTLIEALRGQARYFDFGNSNEQEGRHLNRGLADFKEGFGARTVVHDFYRLDLTQA